MLRDAAPLDHLNEATAAMAQMERDIARLSLELHNSTQGRNLNTFLSRMDTSLGGITHQLALLNDNMQMMILVSKESTTRLGKIDRDLIDIKQRYGEQFTEVMRLIEEGRTESERLSRVQIAQGERLDRAFEHITALEETNQQRLAAVETALQLKRDAARQAVVDGNDGR